MSQLSWELPIDMGLSSDGATPIAVTVVVSAVQEAAQRAIEQAEVIRLSQADSQRFAEALLSPPPPTHDRQGIGPRCFDTV